MVERILKNISLKDWLPYILMIVGFYVNYNIQTTKFTYEIEQLKKEQRETKDLLKRYNIIEFQVDEIYKLLKPEK